MGTTLTPTEIENLLHHAAQRRGCSPDVFRTIVERIAAECSITFAQGLWSISRYDEEPEKWQKFIAEYRLAEEEAAQLGCSLPQLMKAYARLNDQPDQKPLKQ